MCDHFVIEVGGGFFFPWGLVGLTRVPRGGKTYPQGAFGGVDDVPDAAAAGDFDLPLLHVDAGVGRAGEGPFEAVVPRRRYWLVGAGAQNGPGVQGVGCGLPAEFFPAFDGLGGGESQFPLAGGRWRCDAVTALGLNLVRRWARERDRGPRR